MALNGPEGYILSIYVRDVDIHTQLTFHLFSKKGENMKQ